MAIRILNSENITGTITGIGIYTAGNSVKIFEAQRSGGAVAGDWSYDDATTDMSLGTSTSHSFSLKTGNTRALTIDSSQNSTFAGEVDVNGSQITVGTNNSIFAENTLRFKSAGAAFIDHNTVSQSIKFRLSNSSALDVTPLEITPTYLVATGDMYVEDNLYLTDAGTVRAKIQLNASDRDDLDIKAVSLGSNIKFFTQDTERMSIDSSGRTSIIGVFESASSEGILNLKQSSGNGSLGMGFHDAGSNPHFWLQSRSNSDYATTYNLALQPVGGNVGIGTTSPDEKLDITGGYLKFNGGDYGLKGSASLSYNATSDHYFQSGGSTKVTFKADGKVGIGTTAPLIKLDVRGSAYVTGYTVGFSGSPQGNYAYRLTNDAGNSFINVLGGNLGIGTTNPNQKLEVSGGNINIQNGDGGYITWENGSANITVHHNGTGRDLSFKTYNPDNGNNAERMRLDKNGNLGIGTTSPAYQLTVSKNSGFHEAGLNTFQSSAGAAHQELRIISDAHGGGGRTGDIAFYTANSATATEKMRITSAGKVGIGATSPTATLQVGDGTANVLHKIWGSGTAGIQIFTNSPSTGTKIAALEQYFSNEGYLGLYYNGTEKVRLRANDTSFFNGGNVGIGITNPSEKLHVNGRTILQNTEYSDYATGSITTTGVVVATVPSSTNGQSVMITFEATGGSGSVYSVIYSCYNGGGNWYYTKNVLIFGGNIEVAETNGSGSSTLSFSFRATSGSAAYTPRVVMKGSPYGLVSFI